MLLTAAVFFVGHVSVDRVENINGVKVQPGGAALYAAVAAKTLLDNVCLVSVIGKDYPFTDVLSLFSQRCLKTSKLPSTKFSIRYDERWEAHYLKAEYGSGTKISPFIIPLENLEANSIIHISPLPPPRLEKIIKEIRKKAPETKISLNTWIGYMGGKKNKKILRGLAAESDFFIINDSEAKILTETGTLSVALRLLKAKMLVVTLGEFGAIINKENSEVQMVPSLRFSVEKIIDTTGAGDTWCGAFLAAYKQTEDIMKSVTAASVISSIKCTGWGFSKLLNLRFQSVGSIADYVIGLKEGSLQRRISDYYQ